LRYYPLLEARRVAADHGKPWISFLVPVRIAKLTQASVDPNYNTAVLPSPSQLEFDATGLDSPNAVTANARARAATCTMRS